MSDRQYVGIPFRMGGRSREGADCAGLAAMFLAGEMGLQLHIPPDAVAGRTADLLTPFGPETETVLQRGDIVLFSKSGNLCHVAVYTGEGRYLHTLNGTMSRIENGLRLLRRRGLVPAGFVRATDTARVCAALSDSKLGAEVAVGTWILIGITVLSTAASFLLRPKLPRLGNKTGRYGYDGLVTQSSPELPLADLLGKVVVAGNSIYSQLSAKGETITDATTQKSCKVVVLCSGPCEDIDYVTGLRINGLGYSDKYWKNGTNIDGFKVDPAQTKAEAITGDIMSDTGVPSVSLYKGTYGISVPVDVRAQYDRDFPVYGFSGCSYLVFRLINSNKFQTFNLNCQVKGRLCRTFDADGFITATETAEDLSATADGTTVRFKLLREDIRTVTTLQVDGVSFSLMSASSQTGNVFYLNKTKGYIEFVTAPTLGAVIYCSYEYFVREWTQNPAAQLVYLLTELTRGKGQTSFSGGIEQTDGKLIDFQAALDLADHCDETVSWNSQTGQVSEVRYTANYAIDFRKPIQEHLKALLDACNGMLFQSSGKWVLRARKADASVMSFTEAEILADTFAAELVERSTRPNRVKMAFHADDSLNQETEVVVDSQSDQVDRFGTVGNNGVVEETLKLPAVTVIGQAERLAVQFVRESVGSRWIVEFTASILGLALQIGDVIDITHSVQPSWSAKLFRIEELSHDEQDRMRIMASEYVTGASI